MSQTKENFKIQFEDNNEKSVNSSKKKAKKIIKPPDGGYGWVVVIASFFCNVIVDGIIFSFGIFLPEIARDLGATKAETAWIGSLQTGFYLIIGPFVSFLANKYGCRIVAVIGAVVSSFAFALSYNAEKLYILYFTYGILGGIGYGMVYLPSIVIVGFYFEERRAFATGISVSGSGIGNILLAPLLRLSVTKFGWRTTMGYLAGVNFLCVFFALFFKPLKEDAINEEKFEEPKETLKLRRDSQSYRPRTMSSSSTISFAIASLVKNEDIFITNQTKGYKSINETDKSDLNNNNQNEKIDLNSISLPNDKCPVSTEKPNILFDLTLLKSPTFLLFSLSGFLTLFGFFIPIIYINDFSTINGATEEQISLIIPVIGIANTLGRIICGWSTDKPYISVFWVNNIALMTGGIATIILPIYFLEIKLVILYAIVFGLCIGCFAALRSIMTTELFGLERLTDAFGLLLLIQGIATMIGTPIAGWFYDITQSYHISFITTGLVIFLSGALCIPLTHLLLYEKKWEEAKLTKRKRKSEIQSIASTIR